MRPLSAPELLHIWEEGLDKSPVERAVALLAAADPVPSGESFALLPIGQRDGRLMTLRERIFGPDMIALANCPECNELLETKFKIPDIRVENGLDATGTLSMEFQDYRIDYRLPDSRDLMAVSGLEDPSARRNALIEQCILKAEKGNTGTTPGEMPADVLEAVIYRMDESDPQAYTWLSMACPSCGHAWQEHFDILSFFWSELDNWANRTLDEVHILASAYGWRESDILSMDPRRRQFYLGKVFE